MIALYVQPWRNELELSCYADNDSLARDFVATPDVAGASGKTRIAEVKSALKAEARRLARFQ